MQSIINFILILKIISYINMDIENINSYRPEFVQ